MVKKYTDAIFIDTSFFKALFDPEDSFHPEAKKIWQKVNEEKLPMVTSNYILDESFTLLRKRCGCALVRKFRNDLAVTRNISIIRVILSDEAGGWKWFLKNWSNLSFTDCVSFAVMERLGLKRVATFDNHFFRAGFKTE